MCMYRNPIVTPDMGEKSSGGGFLKGHYDEYENHSRPIPAGKQGKMKLSPAEDNHACRIMD